MTKEKLEKEAEEYKEKRRFKSINDDCDVVISQNKWLETLKEAYLAGAEPREKCIAELEKENAELRAKNNNLVASSKTIIGLSDEIENRTMEQLIKAKDLLKKAIRCTWSIDYFVVDEINEFLNEKEKESQFTKEDLIKIISLMQAVIGGKTIQTPNGKGGWVDVKEVLVNDLLLYYDIYRIKPDNIDGIEENCPDILCSDCTKEDCIVRKLGLVSTKEIWEKCRK